ncbi:unnamed protein product [Closterium sp. NIES-53]
MALRYIDACDGRQQRLAHDCSSMRAAALYRITCGTRQLRNRPHTAVTAGARLSPSCRGGARRQVQLVHKLLVTASALGGCFCSWRLRLHLAAASANVCQRHHLTGGSSITWSLSAAPPDALQHLKPCSTGPAAALPDALAACTGAAPALSGNSISSTCVILVSSTSSACL